MIKKITAALLPVLLCMSIAGIIPAAASASSEALPASSSASGSTPLELQSSNMKMNIPKGLYAFTPDTPITDENLLRAGITDWDTQKKEMQKRGSVLLVNAAKGTFTISLTKNENTTTQQYFNMTTMSNAQISSLIQEMCKPQSAANGATSVTTTAKRYTNAQKLPFLDIEIKGNVENKKIAEAAYFTILNGAGYLFETYQENKALTAQQTASLQQLVNSVQVTKFLPKSSAPESSNSDRIQFVVFLLLPLILMVAAIAAIFIVRRVHRSRENKRTAFLLERITAYQAQQKAQKKEAQEKGLPLEEPKVLIENTTKCVAKALKRFSWYDLLLNRKETWISMLVVAALSIAAAVFVHSIPLRVVSAFVAAFCIIYPLLIPRKVFQTENGSFRKMKTRKIRYQFRADDFRVSGAYSGVYPYVQILHVYEVKRYFYLYLGANHIYIINKHTFKKGTTDDLRKLLKEKCPKYKIH